MKAYIYTKDGDLIRHVNCTGVIAADAVQPVTTVVNEQQTVAIVPPECIVIMVKD